MSPHDVIVITSETYPSLFKAFELISHDCGRQAGHRNYAVPDSYADLLPIADQILFELLRDADLDFELLCIGEETEKNAMVEKLGLHATDELLQRFFEEFC